MKFFPIQGSEIASFYTHISDVLESALNNFEKNNISCTLLILKTICEEKSDFLDRYIPYLIKILQKLAKDHISGGNGQEATTSMNTTTTSNPTNQSTEAVARMPSVNNINRKFIKDSAGTLSQLINTINSRIDYLGEHVKSFLGVLLHLIEKSMDVELLTEVTKKLVSPWVLNNSPIMSTKEKVNFLVKMTRFDQSPNSVLHNSFLELMYHIYSDPTIQKSELQSLEGGFIIGLRCKDSTLRNNFFQLFHQSLPTNIMERLLYIFTIQNWESMGVYFWIKQALDLLLSLVSNNSGVIVEFPNLQSKEAKELNYGPNSNNSVKEHHTRFMELLRKSFDTSSVIGPTRELFYQDNEIAYQLWVQTFAQIWKLLSREHQEQFSLVLSNFLCREYHNKQQRCAPNVVQALLDSTLQCSPRPQLPIELIKYLGKTFNCWHTSVKLLEDSMNKDISSSIVPTDLALAELYQLLSEDDLYHTIWKRRLAVPESKVGETLQQHQMWQKAQEVYYNVMNQVQNGSVTNVSVTESTFIESQWIQCAKRLCQWDTLNDIAKSNNYYDLLLESSIKQSDWATLKDTLPKSTLPSDSPMLKIYQCYLSVHDGKPQDLEGLCNNATQMALKHLQLYPDIPMQCHIPMLQLFQQIVELKDTSQIIKELNNSNKQQSITDIKTILGAWRERLPNTWEDILVWNDLLTWRQHVYSLITAALAPTSDVSNPFTYT
jgi:transformation/transcription domain-associated protein